MKLGPNLAKVERALRACGPVRARDLCRARHDAGRTDHAARRTRRRAGALFRDDPRARKREAAVSGALRDRRASARAPAEWITPEARALLERATDLVGYAPYLDRLRRRGRISAVTRATTASSSIARAMRSRWRAEGGASQSCPAAIPAFSRWRRRCSRRSTATPRRRSRRARRAGHQRHAGRGRRGSARRSAHDFCAISLSDNLKPWDLVARRLSAACRGRFRHRALQSRLEGAAAAASSTLSRCCASRRPRDGGRFRARGRPRRRALSSTTLGDADPACVDMARWS